MKKVLYILLLTPLFFVSSCVEEVHGCLDSQACNYNSEATIDNNSCEFADEGYDCDENQGNGNTSLPISTTIWELASIYAFTSTGLTFNTEYPESPELSNEISRRWTFDNANTMVQNSQESDGDYENCFFTYTYFAQNSEIHFYHYDTYYSWINNPNWVWECCESCGDNSGMWGDANGLIVFTIIEHTLNNLVCEWTYDENGLYDVTTRYYFEKVN